MNNIIEPTCVQGRYRDSTMRCSDCIAGKYQTGINLLVCKNCPVGKASSKSKALHCTMCNPGEYQDEEQGTFCKRCEAGRYSNATNASNSDVCSECPAGKWSLQGLSKCHTCPAGRSSNVTGLTSGDDCTPVPAGKYAKTSIEAIPCAIGKYQDEIGQTSCKVCAAGTYTIDEGKTLCTAVAAGKYANASGSAVDCPMGQYQDEEGQTSCKLCSAGYYNDQEGQISCDAPCEAGKYSLTGASFCQNCPAGRYSNQTGLSSGDDCTPVPHGKYASASGSGVDCPIGQYQDEPGQTSCKLCSSGYYNDKEGQISCDTPCEAGKYSLTGASFCQQCPAGRYSNQIGLSSGDDCTPVPAGSYESNDNFTLCPVGQYQNEEGKTSCKLCLAGHYNDKIGQSSCNDKCVAGKYSLAGGSFCIDCPLGMKSQQGASKCDFETCPPGHYQAFIEGQPCQLCPAGKSSNISGAESVEQCNDCLKGKFAPAGQIECFECSSGMISSLDGAKECMQCIYPTIPNDAKTLCVCPVDHYSDNGTCITPCPRGINCRTSGNKVSYLNVIPGNWRLSQNSTLVYPCPGENETCIGGSNTSTQCRNGSHGVLCALCKPNWQRDFGSKRCVRCAEATWFVIVEGTLLVLSGAILISLVLHVNRTKGDGFIRPFIGMWQDLSIYMMFEANWPKSFRALNAWTKIQINFISYVSPACAGVHLSFYTQLILLISVFSALCILVSRNIIWKKLQGQNIIDGFSTGMQDLFIIVLTFYPSICGMAFRFFNCQTIGNASYLVADLSLQCYDTSWWSMFAIVVPIIFCFCVGLPIFAFRFLFQNRDKLDDEHFRDIFGSMYIPYKRTYFGMESGYMILKLLMWATVAFFSAGSPLQFALSVIISIFQLTLQLTLQPFAKPEVNVMQVVNLSLGTMTALLGLCFRYISAVLDSKILVDRVMYTTSRNILEVVIIAITLITYLFFTYKLTKKYHKHFIKFCQKTMDYVRGTVKARKSKENVELTIVNPIARPERL